MRAPDRVTSNLKITSEQDLDKLEIFRPKLESPPNSVKTLEDQVFWKLYIKYFNERINNMREDFRISHKTNRDLPRNFESFQRYYTDNPKLLAALRGRLYQGLSGNVISEITSGKAAHNLGISKVPNPGPAQMLYPDTVFRRSDKGYSAVSTKSRQFSEVRSPKKLIEIVSKDVCEALDKYYGFRYVRRRGLGVTGETIKIDEVILNYDPNPRLFPKDEDETKDLKESIKEIVETFEEEFKVNIQVGFFDPKAK